MTWNEAEHPRDDNGKFTYKNAGSIKSSTDSINNIDDKMQKRANILFNNTEDKKYYWVDANKKAIADRQEKLEQGSFAPHDWKNLAAVNYIHNPIFKKKAIDDVGKEAAENLHMTKKDYYLNTDYAKEHLIFKNYKEVNNELQPYLKKKISEQIGEDKLDSTKGIYINANSDSSKKLAQTLINNEKFSKILKENMQKLQNRIPFNSSISFTDKNFHNALGNVDLLNIIKNKNGDIELLVADTYDFNKNDSNDLVRIGREKQEKGDIIPYFMIYNVIIPKNVKIGTKVK